MDAAALLEGLTPAQRAAVTSDGAPLCILAGAGSGKTRVLTRRIAHRVATGSAEARHVLALTFTRRAAAELAQRLAGSGVRDEVAAGTFHAVAYAQLRRRRLDCGERPPRLLGSRSRLLASLLPKGRTRPAELAAEIDWAKARLVAPADYEPAAAAARRRPPLPPAAVASLYGRYEDEKRRRGVIDFDDLLLLCARAIERDDAFAAAQRWRFRHLFVDEFQDVNPLQLRLLEAWRGGRDDLCVVGDPAQAIYSWNGADPGVIEGFADRFPGATVLSLTENFRSTPQILDAAAAVRDGGAPLRARRAGGVRPTVVAHATDLDEATAVARAVRDRRAPGAPWARTAVLARTHAQLGLVDEALRAAGIPTRMRGTPLVALPEVRAALHEVRRDPSAPFAAVLADLGALAEAAGGGPVADLADLAREYSAVDPTPGADGFLAWLAATGGGEVASPPGDAVELATFHAAKGLEWPVVFLVGLEQGLVPIAHATTEGALAEERRLLYVAITRAEVELHLSWARRRTLGHRPSGRSPSPLLAAIEGAVAASGFDGGGRAESPPRRAPGVARDGRAGPGRRDRTTGLTRRGGPDAGVVAALRAWRAALARAAGVPPTVVMHDRALAAVAAARPTDAAALHDVPGVGPVKARRYGEQLVEVVARVCGP